MTLELNAPPVAIQCDTCGHDNDGSAFANDVGDTCRVFGCFGKMVKSEPLNPEPVCLECGSKAELQPFGNDHSLICFTCSIKPRFENVETCGDCSC